jgi:hypothetical protein
VSARFLVKKDVPFANTSLFQRLNLPALVLFLCANPRITEYHLFHFLIPFRLSDYILSRGKVFVNGILQKVSFVFAGGNGDDPTPATEHLYPPYHLRAVPGGCAGSVRLFVVHLKQTVEMRCISICKGLK